MISRSIPDALPSSRPTHPQFPGARLRTPVILKVAASDEAAYMEERFGPISFIIATENTADSIARAAREKGALTDRAFVASRFRVVQSRVHVQ